VPFILFWIVYGCRQPQFQQGSGEQVRMLWNLIRAPPLLLSQSPTVGSHTGQENSAPNGIDIPHWKYCIFFRLALHTIRVVPPRRAFCILSALHLYGHGCTQATRVSILALTKMYTLFRYFGTFSRALLAIDRIAMRLDLVSLRHIRSRTSARRLCRVV
jgi:hypothetical protein